MNKKMSKRQRDIKTKLMAAVCMLLVSSIMMVSTTYAWFTLSTAPEVTGIQTAVGANGNLEMALLPTTGLLADITSEVGDSAKDATLKNVTWGNLVDLSNNAFYGLDKITLYPSKLNLGADDINKDAAGNPTYLLAALLSTPTYGADGRVDTLTSNTVTSTYVSDGFPNNDLYGVRAVGNASGMTDRQLAYRNYRANASTAGVQAKNAATASLKLNGSALADIALAHGTKPAEGHTKNDVRSLLAIVDDLLGDADTVGVLEYIENGYLNYMIALGASATSPLTDEMFPTYRDALEGAADVYAAQDLLETNGITLDATIETALTKLKATRTAVETAKDELEALLTTYADKADDAKVIEWGNISTALDRLADTDAMTINGIAVGEVMSHMSDLVNSVAKQGLNVEIATGGGVYADIADHCGDYSAAIVIAEVSYGGLTLENTEAKMKTKTTVNPLHLTKMADIVSAAGAPASEGGQTMPITEMYGYVLDLAFRTNAAESNLLLQTEAADRIYGEDGSEQTMGNGSTMTFTSELDTSFNAEDVAELMEAIRIVFFDPNTAGETKPVYATAKLDMTEKVVGADGYTVTAPIKLYELTEATTTVEYEAATSQQISDAQTLVAGRPQLFYGTIAEGNTTYAEATPEQINAGINLFVKKTNTTAAGERWLEDGNAVITALTQNTAQAVSCLVYLDGEEITNADVAATAIQSAVGTMNLQFASSAALDPMDYTPLMNQGGSETTETTAANP